MRALLSVHDKTGLVPFAAALVGHGYELVASGGTAKLLAGAGLTVTTVEALTGFPELLGGRVKTLHPAVHAGILSRRSAADSADLAAHQLAPIDLVAVSLYPFEETVARGAAASDIIEEIDIGGITLLRAAAKNHALVTVVPGPDCYPEVLAALAAPEPTALATARRALAAKTFARTAAYDFLIARWLGAPLEIPGYAPAQELRYGENPHQAASFHAKDGRAPFVQYSGKELSYNNLLDLDAAWTAVSELARPGAVLVKHSSPCGIAMAETLPDAYLAALASDPVSAFGGILALNRPVDEALVAALGDLFLEVIAARSFTEGARARLLEKKKNCRVLAMTDAALLGTRQLKSAVGGLLVQDYDAALPDPAAWTVATQRAPSDAEREALAFAFHAVKHVKSNAIVLATPRGTDGVMATIGIGGGQTNRVDAVRQAIARAGVKAKGAVLASDAFFPFADSIAEATAAGIVAIAQPGGAIRDREVAEAADAAGMAMVFTGRRHFKH
jgi:phosphoribosylaminoimidazolecarboxamide formyltransferase/IMP cyclohydrolase